MTVLFRIGKRVIGPRTSVYVVAEVSAYQGQDFDCHSSTPRMMPEPTRSISVGGSLLSKT